MEAGTSLTSPWLAGTSGVRSGSRAHAHQAWWLGIAAVVACGLVFREFPSYEGPVSLFHSELAAGFTPANLLIFGLALLAAIRCIGRPLQISSLVLGAIYVVALTVCLGIIAGALQGSTQLAGDWKNLLMGALFAFILRATVVRTEQGALDFAGVLVVLSTAWGCFLLGRYMLGGGVINGSVGRTPLFNAGTFAFLTATVAFSVAMLAVGRRDVRWMVGAAVPTVVIMLSFRRFAWFELALILAVLAVGGPWRLRRARWPRILACLAIVLAIIGSVANASGVNRYFDRAASFNALEHSSSKYAATNGSHVDDILDGWAEIKRHPITGLGVGSVFVGKRTVSWKGAGGMVHNGLLHVWLKFGFLGLIVNVALHTFLLLCLARGIRRATRPETAAFRAAVAAYLIAQLVVTSTVVTWAYAGWEGAVITLGLLAAAFAPADWRGAAA